MFKPGDSPIPGYQLVRFIGQGAYGEVWEAQAPGGARAALKFIPLQSAAGGVELKSANAVKSIRHANLIPITAIWVLDRSGNILDDRALKMIEKEARNTATITPDELELKKNLAYLVIAMSLADDSLDSQLERYRKAGDEGIPRTVLLEYIRQAAKGLDFLNEPRHLVDGEKVGIVHRDVKPANLLLLGDSVVVGDFGVATSLRDFDVQATGLVGSLGFMAPEALSRHPTPTTDQYALAITYYYLRTGKMPFEDGHSFDSLSQVHRDGRLDFSLVPDSEGLVLKKATAVPPSPRYSNCSNFVSALSGANQSEESVSTHSHSRWLPIGLAITSLGLIGVIAWSMDGDRSGDTDPPIQPSKNTTAENVPIRSLMFSPADALFELQFEGNATNEQRTSVAGSGEVNFELNENETVRIVADASSPLYESLDETYTFQELKDLDWKLKLKRKSSGEVREQAFEWVDQKKWKEAIELIQWAAEVEPDVLQLPTPLVTSLGRQATGVSVGPEEYVVVAINEAKQASFRFVTPQSIDSNFSRNSKSATTEPSAANWIDLRLGGVLHVFATSEPQQWLVVTLNAIGKVDQQGKYEKLWQANEDDQTLFSTAAVSPNGRTLAVGDLSGGIHLWQLAMDGSLNDYQTVVAHQDAIIGLGFADQGATVYSAAMDRTVVQLGLSDNGGQPSIKTISVPDAVNNQEFVGATITANESLVVATEDQLLLAKATTNALQSCGPTEWGGTISLVRSVTGSNWVLVGTDSVSKPVQLLKLTDETIVSANAEDLASVVTATFSKNGKWIAISGYAGELTLVELTENSPSWYSLPKSAATYRKFLAFTSDDRYLVTVLDSGVEEVWPIDRCHLILKARAKLSAARNSNQ